MVRPPRLLPYVLVRTVPVAALLFVGVGIVADHFIRDAVTSEVERRLTLEAESVAARVDSKLRTLSSVLSAYAGNELVVTGLVDTAVRESTIRPFFQHLTIPGVPDAHVMFSDYRGRPVASTTKMEGDTHDTSWLENVMAGREYFNIEPNGMTVAVPVLYHGRPEGAIVADFDAAQLRRFLELDPHADAAALILNGRILSSTNENFVESRNSDAANGTWIVSATQSEVYPPLRIELAAPVQSAFTTVSEINRLLILALGSATLILVAALILMALSVTRPLARFAHQLRDFRDANDLSRRVSAPGVAEFADVAEACNLMLERLKRVLVSHERLETENRHRRIAEQAVREKEAETQAIVDHVLDGIITITECGIIRTANPAAEQMFGYSAKEMVGHNVRMLMPEPYRGDHDSYIQNYVHTGIAKIIGIGREVTGLRKNGEVFPMELGIASMTVRGERQFTGMVRDITERKRVDQMKSEFISIVSHELRTPLTSLTGSLGLVGGGAFGSLPDKAQALISIAHNNAQRLIRLVNDILDVEKIESGKIELELEHLDPAELVERAIVENEAYGRKYGVKFRLNSDLGETTIEADSQRLMQVLANLLSNAAKFSGEGTEVEVSLTRHRGNVRFSVTDRGPGISEKDIGRIFQKFSQIDSSDSRSKDGTGLGLSISQAIIQLHGSEIGVFSEVGEGATFYFELAEDEPAIPVESDDDSGATPPLSATG